MAQFPALPLFTDAYMADTRHLTAAQHGAYLLLLMTAWRMPDCKLPDDDKFLARCSAMDLRAWKANKPIIMQFWKQDETQKWYQGRLLDERKYVDDKSNKNAKVAKDRWLKLKKTDDANALPERCLIDAPTPTPTPTPTPKKDKSFLFIPMFEEFWEIYPRKINKAKAQKIFCQLLKNGVDHEAIIAGVRNYNEETRGTEERYIAHATTWLNGERWKDEKANGKKILTLEQMKEKFL